MKLILEDSQEKSEAEIPGFLLPAWHCSQKSWQQVANYFSPSTTGKVVPVPG